MIDQLPSPLKITAYVFTSANELSQRWNTANTWLQADPTISNCGVGEAVWVLVVKLHFTNDLKRKDYKVNYCIDPHWGWVYEYFHRMLCHLKEARKKTCQRRDEMPNLHKCVNYKPQIDEISFLKVYCCTYRKMKYE